jgi:hypothetical protein
MQNGPKQTVYIEARKRRFLGDDFVNFRYELLKSNLDEFNRQSVPTKIVNQQKEGVGRVL